LSSVAATGLGTDVAPRWRGGASGIINTAAQLGTAVGIATLLLVAAATSGTPAPGTPPPRVAWAVAVLVAAARAARFAFARPDPIPAGEGDVPARQEAQPEKAAPAQEYAQAEKAAPAQEYAQAGNGTSRPGGCGAAGSLRRDQRPRPSWLTAAILAFRTRAKVFQPR
jgi:MFS family permease